ncbi:hypothetical protein [Flavobacterium piscis]|uniref:O-antigen ligase domain-containing protein n=1 Tax=Flavobacterium piscis TaxID=1114874 RepID=A0ABU1Y426_9FLAO|nr:hypothetical protein [Flavobacterium piscis]MDR7208984.1 hypothetical protein [Flavobacterium piscis]
MLKKLNFSFLFFLKLLFVPVLYELVIGGSGHYLEFGPITFRIVAYLVVIFLAIIYYLEKKVIKKDLSVILLSFSMTLIFSSIVGFSNNAHLGSVLEDLKPLSFFYILLFFAIVVKDIDDIKKISTILKIGPLILGVIYILVIILLLLGKINFTAFYYQQSKIGEIMFRNETLFFYKGFLYLCVGYFFFLLSDGKGNKFGALFLFACIILTLTRGFILFTILISAYYVFFINKNIVLKWITFLLGIIAFSILVPILLDILGDKSDSDSLRYLQINEVIEGINPLSFIIGHGFGVGVESRPVHMELSFLEIFHKQGIIGLAFWFGLFFYIFFLYAKIKIKSYRNIALPFLLSVIFIILQSGTNPYMNNPIGLLMILISVIVFSKLVELQKEKFL